MVIWAGFFFFFFFPFPDLQLVLSMDGPNETNMHAPRGHHFGLLYHLFVLPFIPLVNVNMQEIRSKSHHLIWACKRL